MKTKRLLLSLVVVTAMLIGSSSIAGATCTEFGKVVATQQSGSAYTVWLSPVYSTLPTFYYIFTTSTASLTTKGFIDQLNIAEAANLKVRIQGSAAACGSTGTYRAGGSITSVVTYSLY